jgi:hypothetical protein
MSIFRVRKAVAAALFVGALASVTSCDPRDDSPPPAPSTTPNTTHSRPPVPNTTHGSVRSCRDGTTTTATGRGACSHHGGVA